MKNILITIIVLSAFVSCNRDLTEEKDNKLLQTTQKRIDISTLEKDEKFTGLIRKLNIDTKEENDFSVQTRSGNKIIVESSSISYFENPNSGITTYTFPIKDNDVNKISNLVIEGSGNLANVYVMEYRFPNEDQNTIFKAQLETQSTVKVKKVTIDENEITFRGCYNVSVTLVIPCPCEGHTLPYGCTCRTKPSFFTHHELICNDGDEVDIPLYPTSDNDTETGGGGGPGTGTSSGDGSGTELLMPTQDWYDIKASTLIDFYNLNISLPQFENIVPISCMGNGNPLVGVFESCAIGYLKEAINNNDHIDPWPMMWNKTFSCIFTEFINGNNSVYNNTIDGFSDLENLHLRFNSCENDNASGCQEYTNPTVSSDGFIDIYLDPNSNPIVMAETILHEGIHASILAFLSDKGVSENFQLENTARLLQLHKHYNGYANYTDHKYIEEFYLEKIAEELWKLDNKKYPKNQYLGLSFEGIEFFLTEMGLTSIVSQYAPYKQYNSKIKSNTKLCD